MPGSLEKQGGPALEFDHVSIVYTGHAGDVHALHDVSFAVGDGESVALIGPSGCGKSSLLHAVAGLVAPTAGEVRVHGDALSAPRRETAFIPQDLGLFPWKTVLQNALAGLEIRRVPRAEARERAVAALQQVGLAEFHHVYPKDLSGGMRQRLALARALALDADLFLLDEPLSAIDALLRETLQDMLLDLQSTRGHTQVLVTHSIDEAVYLGQRIFVFTERPGRLAEAIGNPHEPEHGFRDSAEFARMCARVRAALAEGGTAEQSTAESDASRYYAAEGGDVRE